MSMKEISKCSKILRTNFDLITIDNTLYYKDKRTKLYRAADELLGGRISLIDELKDLSPQEQQTLMLYTRQVIAAESYDGILPEYKEMEDRYTAFDNAVWDWQTGRLLDYTDDMIFLSRVGHALKLDAEPVKIVDKFMQDLSLYRPEVETLLYEVMGYAFYRSVRFRKAVILNGPPGCGKSTYLKQIQYLMGEGTYSSLGLGDIGAEYKTYQLCGKLANVGDDISDKYIDDNSTLKKVISGEMITTNVKYALPIAFRPYATCFFASNGLPRVRDTGSALVDRLIVIPCSNTFDRDKADYFMEEKLKDEKAVEYMISRAVKAFMGVLERNHFSENYDTKQVSEQWALDNNPILSFIEDFKEQQGIDTLAGVYVDEIFDEYKNNWTQKMNVKSDYSINTFRHAIENAVPSITSGGAGERVRSRKSSGKTYRFRLVKQGAAQARPDVEIVKTPAANIPVPVEIPEDEDLDLFHDDVPF